MKDIICIRRLKDCGKIMKYTKYTKKDIKSYNDSPLTFYREEKINTKGLVGHYYCDSCGVIMYVYEKDLKNKHFKKAIKESEKLAKLKEGK